MGPPLTISSGSTTISPGNGWSLPERKNIGLCLAHRLDNPPVEIRAIQLADGRPCLTLHRHGHKRFQFAGNLVPYDTHRSDLAEGTESVTQGVFACLTRQVCYTDVHLDSLLISRLTRFAFMIPATRWPPCGGRPQTLRQPTFPARSPPGECQLPFLLAGWVGLTSTFPTQERHILDLGKAIPFSQARHRKTEQRKRLALG